MLIIQIKQGNSLVVLKCKDIILLSLRGLGAVQMFSISINSEFVLRGAAFFKIRGVGSDLIGIFTVTFPSRKIKQTEGN